MIIKFFIIKNTFILYRNVLNINIRSFDNLPVDHNINLKIMFFLTFYFVSATIFYIVLYILISIYIKLFILSFYIINLFFFIFNCVFFLAFCFNLAINTTSRSIFSDIIILFLLYLIFSNLYMVQSF